MRVKLWLKLVKSLEQLQEEKEDVVGLMQLLLKHAGRLNGCDQLALMKLDVLDGFKKIKVCVAYELNGERIDYVPSSLNDVKNQFMKKSMDGKVLLELENMMHFQKMQKYIEKN